MKTIQQITKSIYAAVIIMMISSCIHTYPHGDGVDPTLVRIGVEVNIDVSWETQDIPVTKSETEISDIEYRLIIEFSRNGKNVGRCEHYLTPQQYALGNVKLIMPFDFHAVTYDVIAWLDCVEPGGDQNPYYDTTSLTNVFRTDNHISWKEDKICVCGKTSVNLQEYKDKWGIKVTVPIKLTTPLGRLQIIASDIDEFSEYTAPYLEQGEQYSVCLSFENRLGKGYNIWDNIVTNHVDNPEFYFPLPLNDNTIIEAAFFPGENELLLNAKILIYNSARIIISKSPSIQFPIERGKITIINGKLLTDYYTNNINVNNIWDGEIIIEL